MADIRCPMCSRPNPHTLDVCAYCGARLKPLTLPQTGDRSLPSDWNKPAPQPAAPDQPADDWLSGLHIGGEADDSKSAELAPPPSEEDWLSGLRPADSALPPKGPTGPLGVETAPQLDVDFLSARIGASGGAPAESQPDWLSALRDSSAPSSKPQAAPLVGTPSEISGEAEPELPDWLKTFDASAAAPAAEAGVSDGLQPLAPPAVPQPPESIETPPTAPESVSELPDWLQSFQPPLATASQPIKAKAGPFKAAVPPPESETEVPDWLKSLGAPPTESVQPSALKTPPLMSAEIEAETPDWLKSLETPGAEAPPSIQKVPAIVMPESSEPKTDLPDWLAPTGAPASDQPGSQTELPDWIQSTQPSASDLDFLKPTTPGTPEGGEDLPAWLAALRPSGLEIPGLPPEGAAPPFVPTEKADQLTPVAAVASAIGAAAPKPEEKTSDLAKAELPAWLQALRPVDTQTALVDLEPEREESAGPLAGMRGVLAAESVIALPGKPGATVARFAISDRHTKHAELLRAIIGEETQETQSRARRRFRFNFALDRWLITLALLAAALLPYLALPFVPAMLFPAPTALSPSAANFISTIDSLPTDRPVLAAFEYEPASTGELNAGVEAALNHLLRRSLRVAAVSTFPSGAGVAQLVMDRAAAEAGLVDAYGARYINLGYIPGGASGLRQFAINPQSAVLFDFRDLQNPWSHDAISGVTAVNSFSAILVAAASADSARMWIEQVQPLTGVKLLVVASAAAEPLLNPYYQNDQKQIAGMITGLGGAFAYDNTTGRAAALSGSDPNYAARWPAYGMGLAAAGLILIVGAFVGAAIVVIEAHAETSPSKNAPAAQAAPSGELKRAAPKKK